MTRDRLPTGMTLQKAYGTLDKFKLNRTFFVKTDQEGCSLAASEINAANGITGTSTYPDAYGQDQRKASANTDKLPEEFKYVDTDFQDHEAVESEEKPQIIFKSGTGYKLELFGDEDKLDNELNKHQLKNGYDQVSKNKVAKVKESIDKLKAKPLDKLEILNPEVEQKIDSITKTKSEIKPERIPATTPEIEPEIKSDKKYQIKSNFKSETLKIIEETPQENILEQKQEINSKTGKVGIKSEQIIESDIDSDCDLPISTKSTELNTKLFKNPEIQSEKQTQVTSEISSKLQSQIEPQISLQTASHQVISEIKPQYTTQIKSQSTPQIKSQSTTQVNSQSMPQIKSEYKPEIKPETVEQKLKRIKEESRLTAKTRSDSKSESLPKSEISDFANVDSQTSSEIVAPFKSSVFQSTLTVKSPAVSKPSESILPDVNFYKEGAKDSESEVPEIKTAKRR